MRRIAAAGLAAVLFVVVATTSVQAQKAPAAANGVLELADQTPIVSPGQAFTIAFEATGLPADATLTATLYDRVRSRSELARAIRGAGLRAGRSVTRMPLAAIPRRSDGVLEWTLATDGTTGALSLGQPGVYPITLSVDDADGDEVRLISQLVVPPPNDGSAPPLSVSMIADLAIPTVVGTQAPAVDGEAVRALGALVSALDTVAGFPVTLHINPESVVALALSQESTALSTLQQLRVLTADHSLLAAPYVPVAPDELAAAGLGGELDRQLALGATALGLVTDTEPTAGLWVVPRGLARDGARTAHSGRGAPNRARGRSGEDGHRRRADAGPPVPTRPARREGGRRSGHHHAGPAARQGHRGALPQRLGTRGHRCAGGRRTGRAVVRTAHGGPFGGAAG